MANPYHDKLGRFTTAAKAASYIGIVGGTAMMSAGLKGYGGKHAPSLIAAGIATKSAATYGLLKAHEASYYAARRK